MKDTRVLTAMPGSLITVNEFADYWKVSERTVYRDIDKGALPVLRLPHGHIRIPIEIALNYGKPST